MRYHRPCTRDSLVSYGASFQHKSLVARITVSHDSSAVPFGVSFHFCVESLCAAHEIPVALAPDFVSVTAKPDEFALINPETGTKLNWVCDGHACVVYSKYELPAASLLRTLDPDYVEGQIRDTGR